MERIEVSTAVNELSEIVRYVSQSRVAVELSEAQVPLVRIVPIDESHHSMGALDRALREIPRLDADTDAFEKDIHSVRQSLDKLDDPWKS